MMHGADRTLARPFTPGSVRPPFQSDAVGNAFAAFPAAERTNLLRIRSLIFEIASRMDGIGPLQETLKWGQPAYLTSGKSGSTIRLGRPKEGGYAIFAHCRTSIISDLRNQLGDTFRYDGNRAILFDSAAQPPLDALRHLVVHALTYPHSKKAAPRSTVS